MLSGLGLFFFLTQATPLLAQEVPEQSASVLAPTADSSSDDGASEEKAAAIDETQPEAAPAEAQEAAPATSAAELETMAATMAVAIPPPKDSIDALTDNVSEKKPKMTFSDWARDFLDTRVTFGFADDNVLAGPQESNPSSPSAPNFNPSNSNNLFFDNYDTKDSGFETLTHLAIYAKDPGFFRHWQTEAGLVIRAQINAEANISLSDAGSFIQIHRYLARSEGKEKKEGFTLTLFPMSADRFRLGYSYAISWGGSKIFRNAGAVPGLKFQFNTNRMYAFLGFKTGLTQQDMDDGTKEKDTVWGILGGFGVDIISMLRFEMNGGFFDRGTIDKQEVRTAPFQGFGGSAQLSFHKGMEIGTSIDFRLYKNDPDVASTFFKEERYAKTVSILAQTEFSLLGQTLQNPERARSTVIQKAKAFDVNFKLKSGFFRVHADFLMRDLSFILFNVPSSPSYMDFPKGIQAHSEIFFALGFDYYFEKPRLTPGLIFGVQRPANFTGKANTGNLTNSTLGIQTFVFRSDTDVDILDAKDKVGIVFAGKATLKWELSRIISSALELQYSYDPNKTTFKQDATGIVAPERTHLSPHILGFNFLVRAKF